MPSSGPLQPVRDDGSIADATFELAGLSVFEVVFHHKAGGRGSARSVNADYHEALELLLSRLANQPCSILGIAVDSSVARSLPPEKRELDLKYPIRVAATTDTARLRRTVTRAQKPVARRPGSQPGGGNDQKRIRITVLFDRDVSFEAACALLKKGVKHLD